MSNLYNSAWRNAEDTPSLGIAIDEHFTEQFGPDVLVGGHIALDEDGNVLDIRAYVQSNGPGHTVTPYGDGKEAWDNVVDWLAGLGTNLTMTFWRRPHDLGLPNHPVPPDTNVFDRTTQVSERDDIEYLGHIFTDGTRHGLILNSDDEHTLEGLNIPPAKHIHIDVNPFLSMTPEEKAKAGRAMLDNIADIDPTVAAAMQKVIEHYESGLAPSEATPETMGLVDDALRRLEAQMADEGIEPKRRDPFALPDVNKRPDVPKAFWN